MGFDGAIIELAFVQARCKYKCSALCSAVARAVAHCSWDGPCTSDMGQKLGWGCPPLGELGPHLTQVSKKVSFLLAKVNCRPSVCRLSSVTLLHCTPLSRWRFRQFFYASWYVGTLTSTAYFTEIVPGEGEPLRQEGGLTRAQQLLRWATVWPQ